MLPAVDRHVSRNFVRSCSSRVAEPELAGRYVDEAVRDRRRARQAQVDLDALAALELERVDDVARARGASDSRYEPGGSVAATPGPARSDRMRDAPRRSPDRARSARGRRRDGGGVVRNVSVAGAASALRLLPSASDARSCSPQHPRLALQPELLARAGGARRGGRRARARARARDVENQRRLVGPLGLVEARVDRREQRRALLPQRLPASRDRPRRTPRTRARAARAPRRPVARAVAAARVASCR